MSPATPGTVVHQAPLSTGFPSQECQSRVLYLSPGGLSDSAVRPGSPALQADSLPTEPSGKALDWTVKGFKSQIRKCRLYDLGNDESSEVFNQGMIEGRRRRGQQRMRWLDGIT